MKGDALAAQAPRHELERGDARYPASLLDLERPPERLYVRGSIEALDGPCISIIGARKATPYGLSAAEMAGRIAAECGLVVVSGGALGCDSAAGRAALAAGGRTIVVPGCGADRVYPASSSGLFRDALEHDGAIVSIEKWGTPPAKYTFPKRNEIIAALSKALVIAEAGLPSGTFSTASAAANISREVFAVPGSIFSPSSRGTNALIEQGAAIITDETALELCISYTYGIERCVLDPAERTWGRVLSALVAQPSDANELARRLGCDLLLVMRTIADYEAEGRIVRMPDGRYSPSLVELLRHNREVVKTGRGEPRRPSVPRAEEVGCHSELIL